MILLFFLFLLRQKVNIYSNVFLYSPNGQNKTLASTIKNWYSNVYEPLFKSGSTPLFNILDALLFGKNGFNTIINSMNSYLTNLESD